MLPCQIIQHSFSQHFNRNLTPYNAKWKLLLCETTASSNVYHILKIHAKFRLDHKFTGIETEGNYNDIIKFEWDLNLAFSHDYDRDQNWKLHILHNCIHQHDPAKNFIRIKVYSKLLTPVSFTCDDYLFLGRNFWFTWHYVNSLINS